MRIRTIKEIKEYLDSLKEILIENNPHERFKYIKENSYNNIDESDEIYIKYKLISNKYDNLYKSIDELHFELLGLINRINDKDFKLND